MFMSRVFVKDVALVRMVLWCLLRVDLLLTLVADCVIPVVCLLKDCCATDVAFDLWLFCLVKERTGRATGASGWIGSNFGGDVGRT